MASTWDLGKDRYGSPVTLVMDTMDGSTRFALTAKTMARRDPTRIFLTEDNLRGIAAFITARDGGAK